ncbi:dihydrolipoyl dehydrogenase, partial [Candidatus Micrarchaeota archaeon CG_4_10_14_0_2_um_filter_49_7]
MSDEHFYDLVIIGGGPGGYVCAIRAAQLGGRVALIEKADLGGVCANAGCIPTKALHASADKGLSFEEAKKRMKNAVARSNKGVEFLLKSNNVDVVKGEAKLVSVNQVEVGEKLINGTNIVIATGSCDAELPHIRFGGHVLSGPGLLNLETMPETLAVIGGGYIGCEFASIFNSFGSKVSIIEADGRLLPRIGENEIAETLEKCMKRKGIDVFTNCKVDSVNGNQIIAGGRRIEAVKILLSVGRKPVFPAGLDKIGVNVGKQGILVDEKMKTNIGGVYAIGDAVGGGLAHVASAYGIVAAENILGYENKKGMDYSVIPSCVFTFPEIATVGDIKE